MGNKESRPATPPTVVRTVYRDRPAPPPPPKALTDKPWREEEGIFTQQYEQQLKDEMETQFTSDRVKKANILLLGPIKAGKSSFLNSVASICKNRLANMALSGEAEASFTKTYGQWAPSSGIMKNFCLMDCMGLEREGHGFNVNDACHMVKGHVPRDYKFNPVSPITPDDPYFKPNPKEEDKVHCIVYVVDAEALYGDIPQELKKRIHELQSSLNDLGINRVMILTKIDKLCSKVEEDIANVYRSIKVKDMVAKASEIFQLPQNLIYPIKNYSNETRINYKLNVPILLALGKMLNFAEDYLETHNP